MIYLGWFIFLSICSYLVVFVIKEFVALIKAEADLYHQTKFYKRRVETREAETMAFVLNAIIHDYWDVKKTHPDCKEWGLVQWFDYYSLKSRKKVNN